MKHLFFLFTIFLSLISYSQCTGYQIYESFSSSLPTQGGTWVATSMVYSTTSVRTGTYTSTFNGTNDALRTPLISNPGVLSLWYRRSSNTTAWTLNVQTSTDGTTWTTRGSVTSPSATWTQYTLNIGALGLTNVYIRLVDARASGTHERYVDDLSITSTSSSENTLFPAISNCSQTITNGTTYTFTDRGGTSDTYNNSLSQSFTFSPGTAGMKVEINFSSLVGELGAGGTLYDYIRVYNGPTTASTLIGTYTSVPGSVITSTASGGELTVTFTSDVSTVNTGWVSTIYLVGGCSSPTSLGLSSTSSTSANMSWVASASNPSSGYEWEVRTSGVGGSGSTGLTASGSVSAGVTSSSTSSLTQNTTYTLYVRSNCGSSEYSSWVASSSMTTPYTPPTNDDPTNAIQISVSNSGIYTTYSNTYSTNTTTESTPTCGSYITEDVWFKVVVPNNVTILDFDTQTGDITDGAMSIYRGTIGSLIQIECDDDDGLDGLMPWIYREDFTPGETIYLRFWEYDGGTSGSFKLSVSTPEALPVELLYFEGVKYPTFNSLRWVTASEHNSSHFIIERSGNGDNWDVIGNKDAAGNSQSKINYFYLDNYTNQFNVYYRLVQYDIDGKFKIYGPIIIQGTSTKRIVKYINTLGQEVSPTSSGVIFEVYEDGTMKKIIR
jgi:hypothetical protein